MLWSDVKTLKRGEKSCAEFAAVTQAPQAGYTVLLRACYRDTRSQQGHIAMFAHLGSQPSAQTLSEAAAFADRVFPVSR